MCTAVTYQTKDTYFGRTLDHDQSYGQQIVFTPRNFPLPFRHGRQIHSHFAILGMACVMEGYPLYFDAVNEKGLAMAGLNFPGNAVCGQCVPDRDNIAVFEFIPWLLAQCASLMDVRRLLKTVNLTATPFSEAVPPAQLHWLIADASGAITVEAVAEGLQVYENPVGVMTNNPPFPMQMFRLNDYMGLSPKAPENTFSRELKLEHYCRGMGGLGLPGDLSSMSRFVRAAFTKMNAVSDGTEQGSVSQFFHILGSVDQSRGCCVADGHYETTLYTSCCNLNRGIYYYTTYDNHRISAVDMSRENLDSAGLRCFPLVEGEQIQWQN